jgi:hypothetical protein
VPKTPVLRVERAVCPRCSTAGPRVTLLTSYIVFLQCSKCEHAWELRPADYPATYELPDFAEE